MNLEDELEERLINWSHWIIPFLRNEVGYPKSSTIVNFGLSDSHIRESKPPIPINNLQADEMNGWINIMAIEHPEYSGAVAAWYLRKKGMRTWEVAKLYKMSPTTFKLRLRLARNWLRGRLSIDG